MPADASDADILVAGVAQTLDIPEVDATHLLDMRVNTEVDLEAARLMATDEAETCMEQRDAAEVQRHVENHHKEAGAADKLAARIRALRVLKASKAKRRPVKFARTPG